MCKPIKTDLFQQINLVTALLAKGNGMLTARNFTA